MDVFPRKIDTTDFYDEHIYDLHFCLFSMLKLNYLKRAFYITKMRKYKAISIKVIVRHI